MIADETLARGCNVVTTHAKWGEVRSRTQHPPLRYAAERIKGATKAKSNVRTAESTEQPR